MECIPVLHLGIHLRKQRSLPALPFSIKNRPTPLKILATALRCFILCSAKALLRQFVSVRPVYSTYEYSRFSPPHIYSFVKHFPWQFFSKIWLYCCVSVVFRFIVFMLLILLCKLLCRYVKTADKISTKIMPGVFLPCHVFTHISNTTLARVINAEHVTRDHFCVECGNTIHWSCK